MFCSGGENSEQNTLNGFNLSGLQHKEKYLGTALTQKGTIALKNKGLGLFQLWDRKRQDPAYPFADMQANSLA